MSKHEGGLASAMASRESNFDESDCSSSYSFSARSRDPKAAGHTFGSVRLNLARESKIWGRGVLGPISKPSFRLSLPDWVGKKPRYVFVFWGTSVFFATDSFSSSGREKKSCARAMMSACVKVRGALIR